MEKLSNFEGEATTYDREKVAEEAMEKANALVELKIPQIKELPPEQRIEKLDTLIKELSVTIEGTSMPVHNEHRHVVEALSALLYLEELFARLKKAEALHPEVAQRELA